ncbi:MAG: polyhydroxybutyrate depolymerase, partial [Micromonosporaceae bacterium]
PSGAPAPAAFGASAGPGCGVAAGGGSATLSPWLGGRQRQLRVHLPSRYSGRRALPLVLNLHGTGSSAARQEAMTGMDATADKYSFIVVYPQGARRAGTGFAWDVPGTAGSARGPDDIAFLTRLVALLRDRYCVDDSRVYAAGFSGGARLASQLACHRDAGIAALAAVAGLRAPSPCPLRAGPPGACPPAPAPGTGCARPGHPVSILALHGTADPLNPYAGKGAAYWTYSVPVAARRWAGYAGCAALPLTDRPSQGVTRSAYHGCLGGAVVELYTLAGRGHVWPRATVGGLDADEIIWHFFAAHPRA